MVVSESKGMISVRPVVVVAASNIVELQWGGREEGLISQHGVVYSSEFRHVPRVNGVGRVFSLLNLVRIKALMVREVTTLACFGSLFS
jgi:hypothetical protein